MYQKQQSCNMNRLQQLWQFRVLAWIPTFFFWQWNPHLIKFCHTETWQPHISNYWEELLHIAWPLIQRCITTPWPLKKMPAFKAKGSVSLQGNKNESKSYYLRAKAHLKNTRDEGVRNTAQDHTVTEQLSQLFIRWIRLQIKFREQGIEPFDQLSTPISYKNFIVP